MTSYDDTDDTTAYMRAQGQALQDVVRRAVAEGGDLTEVNRFLDHVVAEGPAGMPRDFLLAPVLFTLGLEAEQQQRPDLAERYDALINERCGPEAINIAVVSGFISFGRSQGWLHADAYDRAAAAAATLSEPNSLAEMLATIERRED